MNYSEEELILKQQGFNDAMERRDLPLPEYTPEEVTVWRTGLKDGKLFWDHYSQVYHDIQQRKYDANEHSITLQGFASIIDDSFDFDAFLTTAERKQWDKGREYGIRFEEVYRRSYNRSLLRVPLYALLIDSFTKKHGIENLPE